MNNSKRLQILIIEPSQIIRTGLQSIIEQCPGYSVCSAIPDISYLNNHSIKSVDIILINPIVIDYSRRNDFRSIISMEVSKRIFAISYSPYEDNYMNQFDGMLSILDSKEQIYSKIKSSFEEQRTETDSATASEDLSKRELSIVSAVARGMTNKEIADELNLSVNTVITHRKNISRKLGINSISGLTVYAITQKLVNLTDF